MLSRLRVGSRRDNGAASVTSTPATVGDSRPFIPLTTHTAQAMTGRCDTFAR